MVGDDDGADFEVNDLVEKTESLSVDLTAQRKNKSKERAVKKPKKVKKRKVASLQNEKEEEQELRKKKEIDTNALNEEMKRSKTKG